MTSRSSLASMTVTAMIGLAVLARSGAARPRVELARCEAFDTFEVRRAIDDALRTTLRERSHDFIVIVDCPDPVTAHLRVEPSATGDALVRSLDLEEVPSDLRFKLLALAVAELSEIAVATETRSTRPIARPRWRPGSRDASGSSAANMSFRSDDVAPHLATIAPQPSEPRIAALAGIGPAGERVRSRSEATTSPRASSWISPRVALRVYPSTGTSLVELGGDLGLRSFRIGIAGAIGRTSDLLGTLHPWLVIATAARPLACRGDVTEACGLVRIAAGAAGVTARSTMAGAVARDAMTPYGEVGLAGELGHRFGAWRAIVRIDAGWAEGLVARSAGREVASLAGFFVAGALGARWP